MIPGDVVQFQFPTQSGYEHSVYIVANNATNYNNYGGVIFTQHTESRKASIQEKINAYVNDLDDLKMRRLSFVAAYF